MINLNNTSFEEFARQYDEEMGDVGDYNHQHTIDPPLFEAIGNPKNLAIYDIGCGNGYIARKLKREGAGEVWASDISLTLIEIAKTKYKAENIKYFSRDGADFQDIPENYFDLVFIHMAIWYIEDISDFLSNINKILKPEGRFIFSVDHPLKWSLYRAIDAVKEEEAREEIEKYLEVRQVKTYNNWTKRQKDLTIFFRPMSYYVNLCSKHNLLTKRVYEPPTKMFRKGHAFESGIPMKMVIETIKKI